MPHRSKQFSTSRSWVRVLANLLTELNLNSKGMTGCYHRHVTQCVSVGHAWQVQGRYVVTHDSDPSLSAPSFTLKVIRGSWIVRDSVITLYSASSHCFQIWAQLSNRVAKISSNSGSFVTEERRREDQHTNRRTATAAENINNNKNILSTTRDVRRDKTIKETWANPFAISQQCSLTFTWGFHTKYCSQAKLHRRVQSNYEPDGPTVELMRLIFVVFVWNYFFLCDKIRPIAKTRAPALKLDWNMNSFSAHGKEFFNCKGTPVAHKLRNEPMWGSFETFDPG